MSLAHVLFILTNAAEIGPKHRKTGFYMPEVAHPFDVFEDAGVAVEFASPAGGAPPVDGYDPTDPSSKALREGLAFRRLSNSRRLADVDVLAYDAVFVPGGLGPMVDLASEPTLKRALAAAWEAGRVVGAVCHGPVALLDVRLSGGAKLLEGRRVTGFSNAEEEGYAKDDVPFLLEDALRREGAGYSSAAPWQAHSVVDGRLVTGQNPASAAPVAREMLSLLGRGSR